MLIGGGVKDDVGAALVKNLGHALLVEDVGDAKVQLGAVGHLAHFPFEEELSRLSAIDHDEPSR